MIRHIVLINFRAEVSEQEISELFSALPALQDLLPGMGAITAGRSDSPEQMERGYMHGFVVDFDSWQSLQAYQDHPQHQALGAKLVAAAEGGIDGILVFDLEV